MEKLWKVEINGVEYAYPDGTAYQKIAEDFQKDYASPILLVTRSGKLQELTRRLDRDCVLEMITLADKPGMQAYERSLVLLLLKAFQDVVGEEQVEKITVEYSISSALFLRAAGSFTLDQALLDRVDARMRELTAEKAPIVKTNVSTDDAVELFAQRNMPDKARLMKYRMESRVNLYTLGDYSDYYYGYMVPDAGYLTCFALQLFENGFVLQLPADKPPHALGAFKPSMKVFREMYDATLRGEALNVADVGQLNETISNGQATQLILTQEALMEKKIGDIAQQIVERKGVRFVMIAGPSSSGKTTFSHRLSTQLIAAGMHPHPIAADDYFKNREDTPRDANGQYDFECLGAMDVEQFNTDMNRLLNGETVEMPHYNFKKGVREYTGDTLTLGESDILVIEGIHCLNEEFTYALPAESKYRIYISCLTTLNVDGHSRIKTTDARLLRRIERDARTRGYSAQATIKMWPSVRRGEEDNIFPFQDSADVVFNSALIYETALMKTYVEPLLMGVPRDSAEYVEAKRLLKFLSCFMPLPSDDVPRTSLIREFVGGGCYKT